MRKRITLLGLLATLTLVSLWGCTSKAKEDCRKPKEAYLESNMYGKIKMNVWNEETSPYDYNQYLEEGNKIVSNYLGDNYHESDIIPMSIVKMYDYSLEPKEVESKNNNKIYLNLNYISDEDDIDMIIAVVQGQLYCNGEIKTTELTDEENEILSKYVVYGLTKKACNSYDKEKFENAIYGNPPKLNLDSYLDELGKVYLGKKKLSRKLNSKITNCFRSFSADGGI